MKETGDAHVTDLQREFEVLADTWTKCCYPIEGQRFDCNHTTARHFRDRLRVARAEIERLRELAFKRDAELAEQTSRADRAERDARLKIEDCLEFVKAVAEMQIRRQPENSGEEFTSDQILPGPDMVHRARAMVKKILEGF